MRKYILKIFTFITIDAFPSFSLSFFYKFSNPRFKQLTRVLCSEQKYKALQGKFRSNEFNNETLPFFLVALSQMNDQAYYLMLKKLEMSEKELSDFFSSLSVISFEMVIVEIFNQAVRQNISTIKKSTSVELISNFINAIVATWTHWKYEDLLNELATTSESLSVRNCIFFNLGDFDEIVTQFNGKEVLSMETFSKHIFNSKIGVLKKYPDLKSLSSLEVNRLARFLRKHLMDNEMSREQFDEIHEMISQNVKSRSNRIRLLLARCEFEYKLGNYDEVIDYSESILKLNYRATSAFSYKAYSLHFSGQFDQARSFIKDWLEIHSNIHNTPQVLRAMQITFVLFEKNIFQSLFPENKLVGIKDALKRQNKLFLYKIYYNSIEESMEFFDGRSKNARIILENFKGTKENSVGKKLYFHTIKNINYQYCFSVMYSEFQVGSTVTCDERFKEILEFNFPDLNFHGMKRVVKKAPIYNYAWFFDKSLLHKIDSYSEIISVGKDVTKYLNTNNRKHGWLKANENILIECIEKNKLNIGVSVGTSHMTKDREIFCYNHQELIEIFDGQDVNLINLDYHFNEEDLRPYPICLPKFDLKDDISKLSVLISKLDFMVVIPNNLMEAAAAFGTKAFVFDPQHRGSYWSQSGSNTYFYSDQVQFCSANSKKEALKILTVNIHEYIEDLKKNLPSIMN